MGTKTRYALLLSVLVLISIVFSACAPQAAPAEAETTTWPDWATASCNRGDQTVVIDQKTVDCAEVLGGKAPNNVQAPAPKPVETGKNGSETAGDPTPSAAAACRDGEMVQSDQVDTPDSALTRLPVGEAARANVVHLAWVGDGFAGLRRAIVITPALGPVWGVHVKEGLFSLAGRGFCGTPAEVAAWADPAEVDSLRRASAATDGSMPPSDEIPVYILNYEARTITTVKAAPNGPTAQEVLDWLEVTFSEGGNHSAVPMHVGD